MDGGERSIDVWTISDLQILVFVDVDPADVKVIIAQSHTTTHAPGQILMRQGSKPTTFFVLYSGSVKTYHGAPDEPQVSKKLLCALAVFGDLEHITDPYQLRIGHRLGAQLK